MTNFHGDEAIFFFLFLQKKIQNGRLKKRSFFNSVNSQYFFVKISWIGPWVSRIEWCKGHWGGLTYVAVRLSNICSKTAKKHQICIFGLFLSLCWPIHEIFTKNIENWRFWKMTFFWVDHFEFFFSKKNKNILLHSHENKSKFIW